MKRHPLSAIVLCALVVACRGSSGEGEAAGGDGGLVADDGQGGAAGMAGRNAGGAVAGEGGGSGGAGVGGGGAGGTLGAGGKGGAAGGSQSAGGNRGTAGSGGSATLGGTGGGAKRDPWLWPFSANSIWNQPIGDGAVMVPANLQSAAHVGVDIQIMLKLKASDPARAVLGSTTFGPGRCGGTEDLGFKLNVPDNWIVPDAGNSPYGGTPNSNFAFLQPDGVTLFEGNVVARCVAAGPVYVPDFFRFPNNRKMQSITGDGLNGGGQGASHMSAMGGTLRKGELTGADPIRHAVKVNPFAQKYLFYSAQVPGFRWPAKAADSYANGGYKGTNAALVMGALLAIPKNVTPESIGIASEPAKKLFFALKHYGAYFTEDAAWDVWDLVVERDAELEFEKKWGFSMFSDIWKADVNRLAKALWIVDNNTATSIGGGGTPLQPLAPGF
ncbi:MAG: hypothetical protein SF187_12420 [Deltaproteobacteria bacterium]|nr:hypothetical protein [Deltaproteobacteria bacterium]